MALLYIAISSAIFPLIAVQGRIYSKAKVSVPLIPVGDLEVNLLQHCLKSLGLLHEKERLGNYINAIQYKIIVE